MSADAAFDITFFNNAAATTKSEGTIALEDLQKKILRETASKKGDLPWLKLAAFGNARTAKGSLRHDANVLAISGVEGDYDNEEISFERAVKILCGANLRAMIYTSPSHTPGKPRWRILCPTSERRPSDTRYGYMARLNGLFGGIFAPESFTLSQSYYYGCVSGNALPLCEITEGRFIDEADDLDAGAIGKANGKAHPNGKKKLDPAAELDAIMSGDRQHVPITKLVGHCARMGVSRDDAKQLLIDCFNRVPDSRRDDRWDEHEAEIGEAIDHIYGKEEVQRSERETVFSKDVGLSAEHAAAVAFLAELPLAQFEQKKKSIAKEIGVTLQALTKLIARWHSTAEPAKLSPPAGSVIVDPLAPFDIAKEIVARRYTTESTQTLVCHGGDFYRWRKTHYEMVEAGSLNAELYRFLDSAELTDGEPFKPGRMLVEDTRHALKATCFIPSSITPPAWRIETRETAELVSCTNGLLRLADRQVIPHTPRYFNTWAVNFAYDEGAPKPTEWFKFLESVWPADREARDTLQEIFGYILSGSNAQQKMFLLIGPKRSGKGTIARVLESLMGRGNYVGLTLASLGRGFGLQPLIGKSLAIVPDARLSGRSHEIVERLLAISGGDTLTLDRKFIDAWTGQIPARIVFLTNVLPSLADSSGAIASRFIVLAFTNSFYGREDHDLAARLMKELPGILNWSLEGWDRLKDRGRFTQPASGQDSIDLLDTLASPIKAFIKDRCKVGPGFSVRTDLLFAAWRRWCELHGREWAGSDSSFGRDLAAAVPGVKKDRRWTEFSFHDEQARATVTDKRREYFYEGIDLEPEAF